MCLLVRQNHPSGLTICWGGEEPEFCSCVAVACHFGILPHSWLAFPLSEMEVLVAVTYLASTF